MPGIRTHFFLGADSRYGYCSLYNSILPGEEVKYIIKGGHAFGKSAFLNRIAERMQEAGHDLECYRSAALPEYLDGLYIPALGTVLIDGDMPHEVTALYPGAVETYMDIGVLYDAGGLREQRDAIVELVNGIEDARARLYRCLSAAGEIKDNIDAAVKTDKILATIKKRVKGLAAREFKGGKSEKGTVLPRFMGAGGEADYSSVRVLCRRICVLDNGFGLACEMLSELRDAAVDAGHDVIVCLDPFEPDKLEHLLLPGLSLAFISCDGEYQGEMYKHIRLDALPREELPRQLKGAVKADRRLLRELLDMCERAREATRELYAELDAIYSERLEPGVAEAMADNFADALGVSGGRRG